MRIWAGFAAVMAAVLLGGWALSAPRSFDDSVFTNLRPDAAAGEAVFWASGCGSCHKGSAGDAQVLAGGQAFPTQFGTFYAPNISPDPENGIGGWTVAQFARAVQDGVSPNGAHYYPALPYSAYAKITPQDMVDLKAFIDTLPPSSRANTPHDIGFPFNIRRSLGLWKLMFADSSYYLQGDLAGDVLRGRYLVEALAHCAECHTPRHVLGGLDRSKWMQGAPNPDGRGRAPDITPQTLGWSAAEIVDYLTTGFTPEYDSVGGHMVHVVENMAKLPEEDRRAIAAYLLALRP